VYAKKFFILVEYVESWIGMISGAEYETVTVRLLGMIAPTLEGGGNKDL